MFRALSSRKSIYGYDRLNEEEPFSGDSQPELMRAKSVPARVFGLSRKPTQVGDPPSKNKNQSHPIFSLFEGRWSRKKKKKVTAKPEFARYMEYLKEGGRWDNSADKPVIHY